MQMTSKTRPISWIKAARKDFEEFPAEAQRICLTALTIAAENGKADIAKPLKGLGSGVFEIALPLRGDAFESSTRCKLARKSGSFTPFRRSRLKASRHRSARWMCFKPGRKN
jgi:hypothetical protein